MLVYTIVAILSAVGLSSFAFYFLFKKLGGSSKISPSDSTFVEEAKHKARELVLEAEKKSLEIKRKADDEVGRIKSETLEKEKKLEAKERYLSDKEKELERKLKGADEEREKVMAKREETEKLRLDVVKRLEAVSGLTKSEAEKKILSETEKVIASEIGKRVKEAEEAAREDSHRKARQILVDAMAKAGTDYVSEYTVSRVKIPSEDIKGRIIGRDGRNIKTFETLTGVDVNLDETPNEIMISCFDPVRREVARVSLEKLVSDGRIQPSRIEEVVAKTKKDLDRIMFEAGESLARAVNVFKLPSDLISYLGKFKYRFSYGQNMIEHTLEETKLGVALAQEVGADVNVVRLGCLLHDIGKVLTDEDGTHVELGVKLLRKYNIPKAVIDCVAQHHEDKPFSSIESVLVHIADSISGARPGARMEDFESFVKRMKDLEDAATSFDGVNKAYAIAAGREVRVIVDSSKVDDGSTFKLASDIARKIESEQTYPGQVKVTVLRETKAVEIAK